LAVVRSREAAPISRFEAYLREHQIEAALGSVGVQSAAPASVAAREAEPTRRCILGIGWALQSLTGDPVRASDLFKLDEK
jgi:hypothetical protein